MFQRRIKDYEPLLKAFEDSPKVEVEHLGGPETIERFPESLAELQEYDALIVSDLSRGTLEPHFVSGAIPGPNKLQTIKDFVEAGGGLLYCGGWMTFQGYRGAGNWQGTPTEDVLPVEIAPIFDDRVERPEGTETALLETDHPALQGIDDGLPAVYGYNRTGPVKDDAALHATVDDDPLIVTGEFGDGRTYVYTSDPGIKWGLDHVEWEDYQQFWVQAIQWATGEH